MSGTGLKQSTHSSKNGNIWTGLEDIVLANTLPCSIQLLSFANSQLRGSRLNCLMLTMMTLSSASLALPLPH